MNIGKFINNKVDYDTMSSFTISEERRGDIGNHDSK